MGPVQRTWVSVAQPLVQTLFKVGAVGVYV
jgi:hypothetical protein